MKNIYKSFALLCMGFAAAACVEENFENDKPKYDTTPGNEIVFSATAGIESGDKGKDTKTVYGDATTTPDENGKKWIEINWAENDMIAIASPEAVGADVAHYIVKGVNQTAGYNEKHQADTLYRLGDSGLQWSGADTYNFYGIYPSIEYDSDKTITGTGETAVPSVYGATTSLSKDGIFTGTMPIDQHYTLTGSSKSGYVASPDMRYAFMTAHNTYDPESEGPITMNFKSMVTALQFDIQPNTINIEKDGIQQMEVVSVSLLSNKGISGDFRYDISAGAEGYTNTNATRMTSIHFDEAPVTLTSKGGSLNVTFFILPEEFDAAEDYLRLQILFKLGSTPLSRIATINTKNIKPGKKYIFNDVLLPEFVEDVPASSWWDTLDPNTILPQISIPVASNVFANPKYLTSIDAYHTQQTLLVSDLWNMGVRGFEIQTQSCTVQGDTPKEAQDRSLGDEGIVAAGEQLNKTFHSAFDELAGLLMSSVDSQNTPTECLFLICTYSAKDDGYNPYVFISNLFNYLDKYCAKGGNTHGITTANFEQINNATTVGDLRGKIAIIIRPGDDDRWLYETSEYKANTAWFGNNATPLTNPYTQLGNISAVPEMGLTGYISEVLVSDWWDRVMLISDWGAESYDIWDRRYGSEYARAATFNDKCVAAGRQTSKKQIELLLGQYSTQNRSISAGTTTGITWVDTEFPTPMEEFNYSHPMSTGAIAYVQEWMRVIPQNGIGPVAFGSSRVSGSTYETLWFKWPESIDYKKRDIRNLFNKAVLTRGEPFNDLYINVLSGYYAINNNNARQSLYPYKQTFTGESESFSPNNPGKGGDFTTLAEEINKYTYNLLSATPKLGDESTLTQNGPWGLVMMDHINTTKDDSGFSSADLVELIMMNNFKFEMSTKICKTCNQDPCVCPKATYNATYTNGGNAISFE